MAPFQKFTEEAKKVLTLAQQEAVVDLLSRPPEEVVKLRGFVADLRAEMKAMVEGRDYEKAAHLQQGERDLLQRLAEAEQAWIDGLQPR